MSVTFRIRRFDPEQSPQPRWQDFTLDCPPGTVVLYALHDIQENQDGSLAYRYSCRGAICGSCAMRINGTAALACKTQVSSLDQRNPIVLEPLLNCDVIKDLAVDQEPFFAALRSVMPWRSRPDPDPSRPVSLEAMSAQHRDQFRRATDCILCQSCFSDCPKRAENSDFIGPAACLAAFQRILHPQETSPADRLKYVCQPGGIFDCDRHANCVKVCPKDCRPMRAIVMLQREARQQGIAAE